MNEEFEEIRLSLKESIINIKYEVEKIKTYYESFFIFEKMFSTENSGKTRLNRTFYNETHEKVFFYVEMIKKILFEKLKEIRDCIVALLESAGLKDIRLDKNLIYDDASFYELFMMDLELTTLNTEEKNELIKKLNTLTMYKNKIHTLKYLISMFDTTPLNKYLNKLGMDDLINSKFIFEVIESYGLQFEELKKFEETLENFENFEKETKDFTSFDVPVELIRRRVDNYVYDNIRYKIALDYNNEVLKLKKTIDLSIVYMENIIANFIEQSCLDLIKKELKRGKIVKTIEIRIIQTKTSIQLAVRNNGFEEKNIHMMYLGVSGTVNNYIVEARNLARMMGGTVDVSTVESSGMQYIFDLKI